MQATIEQDIRDGDPAHTQTIRDLVECVTVQHDATSPDNVRIEITGRLNSLLGDNAFPNHVGGKGVAEEGFEPRHTDYDGVVIVCFY